MEQEYRSTGARVGIATLNLLTPGFGWFRLGRWRAGLFWIALLTLEALVVLAIYATVPIRTFDRFLALAGSLLGLLLLFYAITIWQTWKASAIRSVDVPWYGRWYSLLAMFVAGMGVSQLFSDQAHRHYKSFYAAAESMTPTIARNDRFFADMQPAGEIRRGDIFFFSGPTGPRIYRVVGLSGDRVSIARGVPVINGERAMQRQLGDYPYESMDGPMTAKLIEERLPGEVGSHHVLDDGYFPELDEMAELLVPADHLFVLGDNRDRAADSHVPLEMRGLGLPPVADIKGQPLFFYWSHDRSKIGRQIAF